MKTIYEKIYFSQTTNKQQLAASEYSKRSFYRHKIIYVLPRSDVIHIVDECLGTKAVSMKFIGVENSLAKWQVRGHDLMHATVTSQYVCILSYSAREDDGHILAGLKALTIAYLSSWEARNMSMSQHIKREEIWQYIEF